MTYRVIPVAPFDYVVFGGTGDLARRKLLPALYHRVRDGQIVDGSRIVAVSRSKLTNGAYRAMARKALDDFLPAEAHDRATVERFERMLVHVAVDVSSDTGWDRLRKLLGSADGNIRAFYLAVGPTLFGDICRRLGEKGLVTPSTRVVIEKPFGHDLGSAREVNDAVGAVFAEDQVFRIDHYLGKETVQNLMVLRFGNVLYEPLWNSNLIDHVQITVAETLGAESRGNYYDTAGALRDMVQNHIL
ncbi:MAG: glucose-6-phosphate dehydrogenase, partial [Propylenella sp.]